MRIEKSFVVCAAPNAVWSFLTDPHRVASCLPGAAITGTVDERTYAGTITVKVGPVSTSYRGQVRFDKLDTETRTAEITALGQDVRGKGGADLRMTSQVIERGPEETEVTVVQEVNVTGILAQLGRGMIQDVGDQLFARFTDALRSQLEAARTIVTPSTRTAVEPLTTLTPALAESETTSTPTAVGPVAAPTEPVAEPIQVVSLGAGVFARALGRAVHRPAAWLLVIAAFAILLWFWMLR